ncbi:hypothetical protein [Achromobacter pestifer]|uniref:Protein kinase domain-containing protein n=1 Tax=Achromobacter pestifer TaxID=1353889 RepID=A0A6S6ZIB2_9BURK|nr:hypothetical protein [Achromobacter pestifer]CAB3669440.1 hypothetical protein LMG3431_03781 [Achromobacter pestifer]
MSPPSAVPSDLDAAGILAANGKPRLDDLIRLPPGLKRQEEIEQIVAGLAASLAALHEAGRVHGGICPAALAYDPSGVAFLATPPVAPTPDAEGASRLAGYAAFEQYTDDPAYLCGPWTDVYGLAALAYFLATGSAPPSALARRVRDDCLPLHEWGAGDYGKQFCDAIDRGLAMPAHPRPRTGAAFAAAMGASLPPRDSSLVAPSSDPSDLLAASAPTAPVAEIPAGDGATAWSMADHSADLPLGSPPESPLRGRRVLPLVLVFALLLAGGGYAWVRSMAPPVQMAGTPQAPSPAPAPDPTPAPASASASARNQEAPQAAQPVPSDVAPTPAPVESAASGSAPEAAPDASAGITPNTPAPQASAPAAAVPQAPSPAAPVAVSVAVRPWGEVLINGRSRGVSPPLRELSLAPGRYQVTVRNSSSGDHSMTLTVAPNKAAAITHEFK